jgi:nucleoside-diphosphate-sugar epimerase
LKQRKQPIVYGDGQQTRDFVHVKDITEANMPALNCQQGVGEVINVGTGKSIMISQLAEVLLEHSGKSDLKPICSY